jgi:tRNA pseudouridine55 synthase
LNTAGKTLTTEKTTFGYLLLNKKAGVTSFGSLIPLKKAFGSGKICHTGTLDKFARGLLVVLAGRAVKLSPWFTGCDKKYRALIRFGEETDTLDPEGTVIASAPPPDRAALEAAIPHFLGTIEQVPPLYSAIHVDGRRAHEIARSGKMVEMKKRPVTIHGITLLSFEGPCAEIAVHCSAGTYIRSLARDLALRCASRARLEELTRTGVGCFSLSGAVEVPDARSGGDRILRENLRPVDRDTLAGLGISCVSVDARTAAALAVGKNPADLIGGDRVLSQAVSSGVNSLAVFGPGTACPGPSAILAKKNGRWIYALVGTACYALTGTAWQALPSAAKKRPLPSVFLTGYIWVTRPCWTESGAKRPDCFPRRSPSARTPKKSPVPIHTGEASYRSRKNAPFLRRSGWNCASSLTFREISVQ